MGERHIIYTEYSYEGFHPPVFFWRIEPVSSVNVEGIIKARRSNTNMILIIPVPFRRAFDTGRDTIAGII